MGYFCSSSGDFWNIPAAGANSSTGTGSGVSVSCQRTTSSQSGVEPRWRVRTPNSSLLQPSDNTLQPSCLLNHWSISVCVRVLSRDGDPHVEFLEEGQVLKVKSVRLRDQGLYQCLARNNAGTQMRQFRLTVQGLGLFLLLISHV